MAVDLPGLETSIPVFPGGKQVLTKTAVRIYSMSQESDREKLIFFNKNQIRGIKDSNF